MKETILKVIGFIIVTSGVLGYMYFNILDYNNGIEEFETSQKKQEVDQVLVQIDALYSTNQKEDALDLLLKSISEDKKVDLNKQLALGKIYCDLCKDQPTKDFCPKALWQLNTVLEQDSTNQVAKELLKDLNDFLDPTFPK